jgi:hypothetical protein
MSAVEVLGDDIIERVDALNIAAGDARPIELPVAGDKFDPDQLHRIEAVAAIEQLAVEYRDALKQAALPDVIAEIAQLLLRHHRKQLCRRVDGQHIAPRRFAFGCHGDLPSVGRPGHLCSEVRAGICEAF